jgi:DNA-binding NarL/FixJ family response regulator
MKLLLTRRQAMVFDLILRGKSNKIIARALGISVKGVKYHKTNIFRLYSVSDTEALLQKHAEIQARTGT